MIRRTTWVVLVIFAILVAATILWQRSQENKPEEATPTTAQEDLFDLDANIIRMRLEKVGEGVVELERDDQGIWVLTWPKAEQTDVSSVDAAVTQLLSLRSLSTLEKVPDLKAIGLEPPVYRLLLVLEDGREMILNVGNATPTGSGYYVLVSGRPLYVVSTYGLESFLGLADSPPILPTAALGPETILTPVEETAPATAAP